MDIALSSHSLDMLLNCSQFFPGKAQLAAPRWPSHLSIWLCFPRDYSLSYLSLRACIGLWTSFFCMVLVVTDASCLVRYITRFTEETYASLICLIFIYEALEKLLQLQVIYPVHTPSTLDSLTNYR